MGKKRPPKAAYVVFIGRVRGIFSSWKDCEAQIHGYPGNRLKGFDTTAEARTAWEEFFRSTQRTPSNGTLEIPDKLPAGSLLQDSVRFPLEDQKTSPRKRSFGAIMSTVESNGDESESKRHKRSPRLALPVLPSGREKDIKPEIALDDHAYLSRIEEHYDTEEETRVELTDEQQAVVNMAMMGSNIFLTGAAGSGKTVTLREMIRCLRTRHRPKRAQDVSVQLIAPTGIAALPLDGKTTFSFAGWNPDSLQQPMEQLLANVRQFTRKAIESLKVLIIEEISMVENQFLERLSRLLQSILWSNAPF